MAKTLNMVFNTSNGKKASINLINPKENLTKDQVMVVASDIIAKNIFDTTNGELISVSEINMKNSDKNILA